MDDFDKLKLAYAALFDTEQGRLVIEDLTRHMNKSKVDYTNPDPNLSLYKMGQDSMLKRIFQMKRADNG